MRADAEECLGDWIREMREMRGMSQASVAERLAVRPETVSRWERGLQTPSGARRRAVQRLFGPVDVIGGPAVAEAGTAYAVGASGSQAVADIGPLAIPSVPSGMVLVAVSPEELRLILTHRAVHGSPEEGGR